MLHGVMMGCLPALLAQTEGPGWLANLWSILLLIIGFSLVIFVHELGHFLTAKWAKVRVEKFCIGFGKELFGFTYGGTRYGFNILPLGGYVKMLGQEDFVVDKSGELKVKNDPDSFSGKSIGARMIIVSGGVIMNLLFAAVAFAVVVMVGRLEMPAIVGDVGDNTPAARAGLQTGDRILAINGSAIRSFPELSNRIMLSDPNETLELQVERDGKLVTPSPRVLPEFKQEKQLRQVGIAPPMNLRVMVASLTPNATAADDELRPADRLAGIMVDGTLREYKTLAPFMRAVVAARGAPVEIAVDRPKDASALSEEVLFKSDPEVESSRQLVKVRALWAPLSYAPTDEASGDLLGLVPRMTVLRPWADKSFARAGVLPGDIITRIEGQAYPTYAELRQIIAENPRKELTIEVRRPRTPRDDLSAAAVSFCSRHRESLIAAALADLPAARQHLDQLLQAEASLTDSDRAALRARFAAAPDGPAWRRMLETVDVYALRPFIPKPEWALLGAPPAKVEADLRCMNEDHLVVADVIARYGDRPTPAAAAGIPRGAAIIAVNGRPVREWSELSELFRTHAGQVVEISYRVADELRTTSLSVPLCITAAINLPPDARIVRIAGQSSFPVEVAPGNKQEIALPDWRAIEGLLRASIGKTVSVEYVTYEGEKRTAEFAVTADNTDPWLMRVRYAASFVCYPMKERHPIRNPIVAAGVGFRQAYDATLMTIQSIRHMIFTRQVGLNNVSGPVGILRLGSAAADSGVVNLLWFLALISANLAVINFLPMPIVDGGLFLFLLMEKIRGEPVSIKTQIATNLIGIALIAAVFLLVTYQDIKNWILGA